VCKLLTLVFWVCSGSFKKILKGVRANLLSLSQDSNQNTFLKQDYAAGKQPKLNLKLSTICHFLIIQFLKIIHLSFSDYSVSEENNCDRRNRRCFATSI